MDGNRFVDLQILAHLDEDDFLVRIEKSELNRLIANNPNLCVRHWDGNVPVELEVYGETAVRTREDSSTNNNLTELPHLVGKALSELIGS